MSFGAVLKKNMDRNMATILSLDQGSNFRWRYSATPNQ